MEKNSTQVTSAEGPADHTAGPSRVSKGGRPAAPWRSERRVCANPACGIEFEPQTASQRFCGRPCARTVGNKAMAITERICANPACARSYKPSTGRQEFCSQKCARGQSGERASAVSRGDYYADPVMCPCGKPVKYEGRHSRIYCSPECRMKYGHKRQKDPAAWETRVCRTCTNEFQFRKSNRNMGYYCSNECAAKFTKRRQNIVIDEEFDMVLDSSYEALVWAALRVAKIPVERFDRSLAVEWSAGHWYAPDLWLPRHGLAIECKGVVDPLEDESKWETYGWERGPLLVLDADCMPFVSPSDLALVLDGETFQEHPVWAAANDLYSTLPALEMSAKTDAIMKMHTIELAYDRLRHPRLHIATRAE